MNRSNYDQLNKTKPRTSSTMNTSSTKKTKFFFESKAIYNSFGYGANVKPNG